MPSTAMFLDKARLVKTITVLDPDTELIVEVEIFKDERTGAMIGVDASFPGIKHPQLTEGDEEIAVYNPYEATSLLLLCHEDGELFEDHPL